MKGIAIVLAAMAAQPAWGQQVHKCIGAKGAVSYQSQPCSISEKPAKTWDATPEPPPTNAELWRQHHAREQGKRDSAYLRSLAGRTTATASGASIPIIASRDPSACEAAKSSRARTLEAVGIRRTHDLLRSLDDAVRKACR